MGMPPLAGACPISVWQRYGKRTCNAPPLAVGAHVAHGAG